MDVPMEHCKFGKTPAGVCLTPACTKKRWSSDTTGYCRDCKIAKGIPVAGRKAAPVTHVDPASVPTLGDDFIDDLLAIVPEESMIAAMRQLFDVTRVAAPRIALTTEQRIWLLRKAVGHRLHFCTVSDVTELPTHGGANGHG